MKEQRFTVYINEEIVARDLDLNTAAVLMKALFQEYYLDRLMVIKIERED